MEINNRKVDIIVYYWYDHCLLRGTGIENHIEEAIDNHDWIQFKLYQKILNNMVTEGQNNKKWVYLPDTVSVKYEDGGWESVKLTEEIFAHIDANEYECG